jgi:hypothetical protein
MSDNSEQEQFTSNRAESYLLIDPDNEFNKKLMELGTRIDKLLNNPGIKDNDEAMSILDDLLGAVYALVFANHHYFENRTNKPIEKDPVLTRASQIRNCKIRIAGKWIAGWHFNSALYRIAAVYHRLLKLVTNINCEKVEGCLHEAKNKYNWTNFITDKIYREVNYLKHRRKGIYASRTARIKNAVSGMDELLLLFEKWRESLAAKQKPKN